jgi:ABC-type multidrug transport system fused ATPase/permease subunit
MSYYQSIKYLLGAEFKKVIPLSILFLLISTVDLVGIGLIGSYVAIIIDPSFLQNYVEYDFLNFLKSYNHGQSILFIGICLIVIFIIKFAFLLFSNYLIVAFAALEQAKIQKLLISGILNQSYENFLTSNSGDNLSSIANFSGNYREVLQAILQSLSNIIVIAVVSVFLGITSLLTLTTLILMLGFVLGIYNFIFAKRIHSYGKDYADGASTMIQGATEISSGLKEIKTLGKEQFFLELISNSADKIAKAALRLNFLGVIPRNLIEVILIMFVVLIVGVNIGEDEELASIVSLLGIFMAGMIRIAPLMSQLQISWNTLIYGKQPVMTLSLIIQEQNENGSEIINTNSPIDTPNLYEEFAKLELNKISYKYPTTTFNSISDLSLTIEKGDFIGLIGPSGSGKTSLINIILGFLKPTSGSIQFNDKNLEENISLWRNKCAYLPQDIFLINGSFRENITFMKDSEDSTILERAIKLSKLSEFINNLPDGIDTNLGDKGVRLSGGQKQRVAIARAIYHQRDLLLLDESTSALDANTEQEVMDELIGLRNEKTIIAIAHRISTLKDCNKIFKLSSGKIEGPFSYQEILSLK